MLNSRSCVKPPTEEQFKEVARDLHIDIADSELKSYMNLVNASLVAFDVLARIPDNVPAVKYPRAPGYKPTAQENPYNAWYVKTDIQGEKSGKLSGKTIAVKDNVCVAGVPMMNGSSTLEGYTPDVDATIITRILQAGGTIKGKVHCEDLCFSGGSHTNATGPVINPHKQGYSSGGSSSGSAVVVATKEVDIAIGGDQGGSIRIPSSYSGTFGMKPTWGLVPYTGIFSIEYTIDHTGPITANVKDNALMLEVLAGPDGLDGRQSIPHTVKFDYTEGLDKGIKGLKVGILKEGFNLQGSEDVVNNQVKEATKVFSKLGAEVTEISIPMHSLGPAIWSAIALEGATDQMMFGNSYGTGHKGLYVTSQMDVYSGWTQKANQLADSVKVSVLAGQFMRKYHHGHFYAKAQNLARNLTKAYDDALQQCDVLVLPTLPRRADPIPKSDASREEYITAAFGMIANTCPFDVSGHPAMTVPCAKEDGLPIGMMLVGKHFDEKTIYKFAYAFEQAVDMKSITSLK